LRSSEGLLRSITVLQGKVNKLALGNSKDDFKKKVFPEIFKTFWKSLIFRLNCYEIKLFTTCFA
jgi:hypothetical protein